MLLVEFFDEFGNFVLETGFIYIVQELVEFHDRALF